MTSLQSNRPDAAKYLDIIFDKMHMYKDIVYTLCSTMMDSKRLTMLRIMEGTSTYKHCGNGK